MPLPWVRMAFCVWHICCWCVILYVIGSVQSLNCVRLFAWTAACQAFGKVSACNRGDPGFDSWVRKIPWRRKWQPTLVLLPGEFHGLRSLVGYSPWSCKESDTTERLHFHFLSLLFDYSKNISLFWFLDICFAQKVLFSLRGLLYLTLSILEIDFCE